MAEASFSATFYALKWKPKGAASKNGILLVFCCVSMYSLQTSDIELTRYDHNHSIETLQHMAVPQPREAKACVH